jgi:hypothetical protein
MKMIQNTIIVFMATVMILGGSHNMSVDALLTPNPLGSVKDTLPYFCRSVSRSVVPSTSRTTMMIGFQNDSDVHSRNEDQTTTKNITTSRQRFLSDLGTLALATLASGIAIPTNSAFAKSYSENAANLERINNGDFSGGAVFNNNPTTEGAKKRRAMTGCKTPIALEEASYGILKQKNPLSEKECNTMVMSGETEFMLQALRNLDCPKSPNGICSSRP